MLVCGSVVTADMTDDVCRLGGNVGDGGGRVERSGLIAESPQTLTRRSS